MDSEQELDQRVTRTRRAIRAALLELISETDYVHVSVKALTERADIGYATFFRHYKSKDQLMALILTELLDDLESRLQPGMTTYEEVLTLYKFVQEKRELCLAALKLPRSNPASIMAWKRIDELALQRFMARKDWKIPLDVSIKHLVASLWGMIRWWLKEGEHYSPEQIANFHTALILKQTKDAQLDPRRQPADQLTPDQDDRRNVSIEAAPISPR